jgi:hypothetical protein
MQLLFCIRWKQNLSKRATTCDQDIKALDLGDYWRKKEVNSLKEAELFDPI